MKNKSTRLTALAFVLVLAAALTLASQLAGAQPQGKYRPGPPPVNANAARESGAGENRNAPVGIPDSACRRRCRASYRRCLRGTNRRACERRLRNCYRLCPQ